jgi:THO complex subunit 2
MFSWPLAIPLTRPRDACAIVDGPAQGLSFFCATVCQKYPTVELGGLLQYIQDSLKSGTSLPVLLLGDLITQMSGITRSETKAESMTREQLEAQAGGKTLKSSGVGLRPNTKRSSTRLRDALVKHQLVVPIFVLIAQQVGAQRGGVSMHEDRWHGLLQQYAAFLFSTMPPTEYAVLVPAVSEICAEYHLEPELAFFMWRPAIAHLPPRSFSLQLESVLPAATLERLSPTLYVAFWSLQLYDIFVPSSRYDAEITNLRMQVDELNRFVVPIGESDEERTASIQRVKDRGRAMASISALVAEQKAQMERHKIVIERLATSKDQWFSEESDITTAAEVMDHFLQHCILPRCVFSPADAVYCAKFVQQTHAQGTPCFSTLQYYNKLLRDCRRTSPAALSGRLPTWASSSRSRSRCSCTGSRRPRPSPRSAPSCPASPSPS